MTEKHVPEPDDAEGQSANEVEGELGDNIEAELLDEIDAEAAALIDAENAKETSPSEHLADLLRITAEFKNYRTRTEEQLVRQLVRAKAEAAKALLPVLDDLELAEKHGDLVEGSAFATIAAKMRTAGAGLGLETFGAKGEAFDPNIHDAMLQVPNAEVSTPVVGEVVSVGYRIGDELVRPAKVVVWAPTE